MLDTPPASQGGTCLIRLFHAITRLIFSPPISPHHIIHYSISLSLTLAGFRNQTERHFDDYARRKHFRQAAVAVVRAEAERGEAESRGER